MGARGPRPLPTALLARRGSWRAKNKPDEPKPPPGPPPCPDWLDEAGKAMWEELLPLLLETRILTKIDGNALGRYCLLWSRWRQAEDFIRRFGTTYPIKDGRGNIKCFAQFPQVSIAHRLALLLGKLEQEFGLTPSSRSRVVITPVPDAQARARSDFFAIPPRVVGGNAS